MNSNSNNVKISAIITSGGASTRFGSNKLLEKIGDYSVIETTVLKFIDLVDEIIIPTKEDVKDHILNSKALKPYQNKIKFAPSGKTRQLSVFSGLQNCSNPDIVLIHDGARPFIEKNIIKKAIEKTIEKKAVLVGVVAVDTIKKVKNGKIIETLDRNEIFQAQTPQCFDFKLIKKIHEHFKDTPDFTDDCAMAEAYNVEVYILEGSKNNIKITLKEDLEKFG